MDEPKIDWSSLDPSRDTERWNHLVESIADRAVARRQQRLTIAYQLLAWGRPVLAAAATVTLVMGARMLLHTEQPNAITRYYQQAYTLAQWVEAKERPTPSNVLQLLEETNAYR